MLFVWRFPVFQWISGRARVSHKAPPYQIRSPTKIRVHPAAAHPGRPRAPPPIGRPRPPGSHAPSGGQGVPPQRQEEGQERNLALRIREDDLAATKVSFFNRCRCGVALITVCRGDTDEEAAEDFELLICEPEQADCHGGG